MNQEQDEDQALFQKLVNAKEDIKLTAKEAKRLCEVLSPPRPLLLFGKGMQKIPRRWDK